MILLHGNNPFTTHWLYWTGLHIYSIDQANSGTYVLSSDLYTRILIVVLIAGTTTATKRLILTILFSKRQCREFKPRLEAILSEMILVTEVAALSEQAQIMSEMAEEDKGGEAPPAPVETPKALRGDVRWGDIRALDDASPTPADTEEPEEEVLRVSGGSQLSGGEAAFDRSSAMKQAYNMRRGMSMNSSGSLRIKDMLDRWDVPVNKAEKAEVSISDVLKFKRALTFMDHAYPFGKAFGPASDRDTCITSAHHVYERLTKLSPDEPVLSFDVLELMLVDEAGNIDEEKKKTLRKLFRPDKNNKLTLLAFITICDGVYKRLRFFRASVGNASVIDNVLEGMLNGMFYFVLFLFLSSLLQFNPWALLVSLTSVLVSVSFAFGSSVSKYVDGILLIAVRRPYDLGDRIFIGDAEMSQVNDNSNSTSFVEGTCDGSQ
jgi:hypothetical protein